MRSRRSAHRACLRVGEHRPAAQLPDVTLPSRTTQLRSACALRVAQIRRPGPAPRPASGTDPFGGVGRRGGRTSATRSDSGLSGSAHRADHRRGARRDGAAQGLVGERQQVLDAAPPRAMTMTSTSGSGRVRPGRDDLGDGGRPLHGGVADRRSAHRGPALAAATVVTSCSAALARPVIRPMVDGRNGSGRLSRGSNSPSASSSWRSRSIAPAARRADRANRVDPQRERSAHGVELRFAADDDLGALGQFHRAAATRSRGQMMSSDMLAAGSRKHHVRGRAGRTFIWVNCPRPRPCRACRSRPTRVATARPARGSPGAALLGLVTSRSRG